MPCLQSIVIVLHVPGPHSSIDPLAPSYSSTLSLCGYCGKSVPSRLFSKANCHATVILSCRSSSLGLTLDPQLIRDLTVLITSSTVRFHSITWHKYLKKLLTCAPSSVPSCHFVATTVLAVGGETALIPTGCLLADYPGPLWHAQW